MILVAVKTLLAFLRKTSLGIFLTLLGFRPIFRCNRSREKKLLARERLRFAQAAFPVSHHSGFGNQKTSVTSRDSWKEMDALVVAPNGLLGNGDRTPRFFLAAYSETLSKHVGPRRLGNELRHGCSIRSKLRGGAGAEQLDHRIAVVRINNYHTEPTALKTCFEIAKLG